MFSHGTLMLDSDIEEVVKSLTVNEKKLITKGIKSIRSRVANIQEFLDEPMDMETFKKTLLHSIFKGEAVEQYVLTDKDWKQIDALSNEKYRNFDWNYGKNPKYNYEVKQKFPGGMLELKIDVRNGIMQDVKIYGDFFGVGEIADVESKLKGLPHQKQSVEAEIEKIDFTHYFGRVTAEEFLSLIAI